MAIMDNKEIRDKEVAEAMLMSVMSVGRYRRGKQEPPLYIKRYAALLYEAGKLRILPSWLK